VSGALCLIAALAILSLFLDKIRLIRPPAAAARSQHLREDVGNEKCKAERAFPILLQLMRIPLLAARLIG
jgi:hypothetical protein